MIMETQVNLAKLKEEEINARLDAKVAKAVYHQLVREWEFLHRLVKQAESKVLVCVLLLILVGGCNTAHGVFKDSAWLLDRAAENTEVQESK